MQANVAENEGTLPPKAQSIMGHVQVENAVLFFSLQRSATQNILMHEIHSESIAFVVAYTFHKQ